MGEFRYSTQLITCPSQGTILVAMIVRHILFIRIVHPQPTPVFLPSGDRQQLDIPGHGDQPICTVLGLADGPDVRRVPIAHIARIIGI